jgi:hypothetical protein
MLEIISIVLASLLALPARAQDKPQVWFHTPGPHEGGIASDAVVRVRITAQSPDTDSSMPVGVRQVRHTVTVLDVYERHPEIAAGSVRELRQSARLDQADGQNSSIQEILPVGTEWILGLWWNSRQAAYWIVNGSSALEVKDGRLVRHSDYPLIRKWDGRSVEEYEQELRICTPRPLHLPNDSSDGKAPEVGC